MLGLIAILAFVTPTQGDPRDPSFSDLQALAKKTVEKKIVYYRAPIYEEKGKVLRVLSALPQLSKPAVDDNVFATLESLVTVEVFKQNPPSNANKKAWQSSFSRVDEFYQSTYAMRLTLDKNKYRERLGEGTEVLAQAINGYASKTKGFKAQVLYEKSIISVTFVTKPVEANLYMMSVLDYELAEMRKQNPDKMLMRSVVVPREENVNYVGEVFYITEVQGKYSPRRGIMITKAGKLELP